MIVNVLLAATILATAPDLDEEANLEANSELPEMMILEEGMAQDELFQEDPFLADDDTDHESEF